MLCRTLAILNLLNLEVIVIGSIFVRAELLLRPAMERSIAREAFSISARVCKILHAALGDEIDQYEALAVASYRMGKRYERRCFVVHTRFSGPEEVLTRLTERYPALLPQRDGIEAAYNILRDNFARGGKLLLCGNGGSAADALHIAGELMKSFILPRRPDPDFVRTVRERFPEDAAFLLGKLERALPAIPLVESAAVSTAVQNDTASVLVFAQQVYGLGRKGDVLLGISTSGNSQNVLYAAETARALGMGVVTLTGRAPNRLTALSDCQIAVDDTETFRIQELHLPVYHALCLMLEQFFFAE